MQQEPLQEGSARPVVPRRVFVGGMPFSMEVFPAGWAHPACSLCCNALQGGGSMLHPHVQASP